MALVTTTCIIVCVCVCVCVRACLTERAYGHTDISDSGDGAVTVFRLLSLHFQLHLISRVLFEAGVVTRTPIDCSVCCFRLPSAPVSV